MYKSYYPKRKNKYFINIIIIAFVIFIILFSFIFINFNTINIIDGEIDTYLDEAARNNSISIRKKIDGDLNILKGIAAVIGNSESMDVDSWINILKNQNVFINYNRVGIILPDGKSYSNVGYGVDVSDREYFQRAMNGETYISDIIIDKTKNLPTVAYVTPILNNSTIVGVLGVWIYLEDYEKALDMSSVDSKGYLYIVDDNLNVIVHSKDQGNSENPDLIFKSIIEKNSIRMKNNMKSGEYDKISFNADNKKMRMTYLPLNINNWYLIAVIPNDVTISNTIFIKHMTIIFGGIIAIIFLFMLIYILVEQNRYKKSLQQMAYVDELTGYSNKNNFTLNAEYLIKRESNQYAFLTLNIEKFRLVNEIMGYENGSRLIKHIADTINMNILSKEFFGRISADNFYILAIYKGKTELEKRLNKLIDEISNTKDSLDFYFNINVNIGIYVISNTDMPIDAISGRAGMALSTIRGSNKSGYCFYNEEIRNRVVEERQIESEMDDALKNGNFQVYLQPKYDLETEKIAGAEALIRWKHPGKGMIMPDRFIPIFERNGFIAKIDLFVIEEICRLNQKWIKQGKKPLLISVNQSRINLHDPAYMDNLINIINKHEIHPSFVELEITESLFYDKAYELVEIIKNLRDIGFKISIDDFGTGYSSLNMLKEIYVDVIKLDREFIKETADDRGKTIVENIVTMIENIGIHTIAEGIETRQQVDFLKMTGCKQAQGYYFARPMPITEFETLIEEN